MFCHSQPNIKLKQKVNYTFNIKWIQTMVQCSVKCMSVEHLPKRNNLYTVYTKATLSIIHITAKAALLFVSAATKQH